MEAMAGLVMAAGAVGFLLGYGVREVCRSAAGLKLDVVVTSFISLASPCWREPVRYRKREGKAVGFVWPAALRWLSSLLARAHGRASARRDYLRNKKQQSTGAFFKVELYE